MWSHTGRIKIPAKMRMRGVLLYKYCSTHIAGFAKALLGVAPGHPNKPPQG